MPKQQWKITLQLQQKSDSYGYDALGSTELTIPVEDGNDVETLGDVVTAHARAIETTARLTRRSVEAEALS